MATVKDRDRHECRLRFRVMGTKELKELAAMIETNDKAQREVRELIVAELKDRKVREENIPDGVPDAYTVYDEADLLGRLHLVRDRSRGVRRRRSA